MSTSQVLIKFCSKNKTEHVYTRTYLLCKVKSKMVRKRSQQAIYNERLRNLAKVRAAKRRMGGGKRKCVGGGKRKYHKHQGGALSDYIPLLSTLTNATGTAASYVPGYSTAKGYYDSAVGTYNTGKNLYNTYNITVKPAFDLYNSLNGGDEVPLVNKKMLPPPLPLDGPPTDHNSLQQSERNIFHNKQLARQREIDAEIAANTKRAETMLRGEIPTSKETAANKFGFLKSTIDLGCKIKPISFIDNALRATNTHNRVRSFLIDKGLGSLVNGADLAIQAGFGRYRGLRHRTEKVGSMRRAKRRVHIRW